MRVDLGMQKKEIQRDAMRQPATSGDQEATPLVAMDDLVKKARLFATELHQRIDQRRKYSNQPYDVHLKAVADIMIGISADQEMIAAAWLHDTVEDTPATIEDIDREFGSHVAGLVEQLTDVSKPGDGNRAARKMLDVRHSARATVRAKPIKLADQTDNAADISRHVPKFARVFIKEARALMEVLQEADAGLYSRADRVLRECAAKLAPVESADVLESVSGFSDFFSATNQWHVMRDFTKVFTAKDIAEPLHCLDDDLPVKQVCEHMQKAEYAIAGMLRDDSVCGYTLLSDLSDKESESCTREIAPIQVVVPEASLTDVIHVLTLRDWCFVSLEGEPAGVIGRQDIQKPIVRMWLFGMVTFFELFMTQRIGALWPDNAWNEFISPARFQKARTLQEERCRRNQVCTLIDCLQLSDKAQILTRDKELLAALGFKSAGAAKRVIKELEALRNNLAHAQDIVTDNWAQIVRFARRIEEVDTDAEPE